MKSIMVKMSVREAEWICNSLADDVVRYTEVDSESTARKRARFMAEALDKLRDRIIKLIEH